MNKKSGKPKPSLHKLGDKILYQGNEYKIHKDSIGRNYWKKINQKKTALVRSPLTRSKKRKNVRVATPLAGERGKCREPMEMRGLMLDIARHYIPIEQIAEILDVMSKIGMNTLHLHLSDDQSFPVELNTIHNKNFKFSINDQIALASVAKKKGIDLIPEIDIPGHSTALQILLGVDLDPETKMGTITHNYIDIKQLPTIQKIFLELAKRFKSSYIHIGGDEASKYKQFPALISSMAEFSAKNKLGLIAWDDVLTALGPSKIPKNLTIQRWRFRTAYTKLPHVSQIINSISTAYYLDRAYDPISVYSANPNMKQGEIDGEPIYPIGVIAPLWTELVDKNNIMSTLFPSLYAISHRLNCPNIKEKEVGKILYSYCTKYGFYSPMKTWKTRRWYKFELGETKGKMDPRSTSSVNVDTKLDRLHDTYPVFSDDLVRILYHLEQKTLHKTAIPKNIKSKFIKYAMEAFQTDMSYVIEQKRSWKSKVKNIVKEHQTRESDLMKKKTLVHGNGLIPILKHIVSL